MLAAGCARAESGARSAALSDSTATGRAALAVRGRYTSSDAEATGAWTWTSARGAVYVLVDVQSTVAGFVQARTDLWASGDSDVVRLGQSDAMPAAAEIGAYAFEDLTGDGLPDLFGYVADSTGVRYPIFIPGARGALAEEIEQATSSWRFVLAEEHVPEVLRGAAGACALQLWTAAPAPDNGPEGWRWLPILPGGHLGAPQAVAPHCETAPPQPPSGLQPTPARP
jgi:hypothetical protein